MKRKEKKFSKLVIEVIEKAKSHNNNNPDYNIEYYHEILEVAGMDEYNLTLERAREIIEDFS